MRLRDGRHAPLAARLTGLDPATATSLLIGRDIMLDWPAEIESTRAGVALIRTTANLIVRFCPRLRLRPTTALAADLASHLAAIDSECDPIRQPTPGAMVVHLGGGRGADVTGSADGWLAHVSGYGQALAPLRASDIVVGAHGAAALVASQVFARALPLDPSVAGPSPTTAYSLFEYGPPTMSPPLIADVGIDLVLLAGVGAVGQACVDVLVSSSVIGRLDVVDHGYVDDITNLNRSVLALESDLAAKTAKVDLAVRRASGFALTVEPHERALDDLVASMAAGDVPWPRVVLSALDNRDARWALQGLWPDLVLEGATGDTMAQIFRHAHGDPTACLRCLHTDARSGDDYLDSMARATGLDRSRIAAALAGAPDLIDDEDVERASPETRELIARNIGRDICGFLGDVERYLGPDAEVVQLSVAFTSYLAGTLLAGELIKAAAGVASPFIGRYQIDPIANLLPELPFTQAPDLGCFCQQRRSVIEAVRTIANKQRNRSS